jgi:hypothetical protein
MQAARSRNHKVNFMNEPRFAKEGIGMTPSDRRPLVLFFDIAVKRLQVELELAEMLGLKLVDLELKGDQAIKRSVEEQKVKEEVPTTNLQRVLAADIAEVAAKLDQKLLQFLHQSTMQVGFGVSRWKVEKIDEIGILEDRRGVGM